MIDTGDPWPDLSVTTKDAAGVPGNATLVVLTITLPDGTTVLPAVTAAGSGVYTAAYTPTLPGRHTARWVATGVNASAFTDAIDVDEAATGIVSLADVRARLNLTSTANDEELRDYIDAATDFIEARIGPVVRRTITETVTPSGGVLWLRNPIAKPTAVVAAYGSPGTYDVAGMYLDSAGTVSYGYTTGTWFTYPVTVTYLAGMTIVPSLIRQAAMNYVAWCWESQRGPSGSPFQGGDDLAVGAPATVPYKILQALEPYTAAVVA